MDVDGGRDALKKRLFQSCDKDGDGALKKAEMRELAGLVGFEGSDAEWDEEYQKLCSEHKIRPLDGIPEVVVMKLLDDESDTGCYCTDKEIMQLLQGDAAPAPPNVSKAVLPPFPLSKAAQSARTSVKEQDDGDSKRVFFAGANFSTDEAVLRLSFEEAGRIEDFTLFRMPDGRSRGMGRVEFSSSGEAQHAILLLHQREIDGRQLMVKADTREDQGEDAPGRGAGNSGGAKGKGDRGKGKGSGKGSGYGGYGGSADFGSNGTNYYSHGGNDYYGGGKGGNGCGSNYYSKGGGGYSGYHSGVGDGRTVFFGGASFDTSAGYLQKQFQECGRITQFWLFQLPDGRSRGMGVVQYQTAREAQDAIHMMHGMMVDGRELLVKDDDVGALQASGQQDYAVGWRSDGEGGGGKGGKGGGGGFGGGSCWSGKGGKEGFGGKGGKMDKGFGGSKGSGKGAAGGGGGSGCSAAPWSNRVFFAGAPFSTPTAEVQEYFQEFGEIRSFTLFRLPDGRSRGMGVCTYHSSDTAAQAMRRGISIDGRPLYMQEDTSQYCGDQPLGKDGMGKGGHMSGGGDALATYGPTPRMRQQSTRSAPYRDENEEAYGPVPNVDPAKAVFFANVPFGTTESFLRGKFETVGPVKNIKLFITPDGKSRGMGVVEYTTAAAAMRAYNDLHEQIVSGRPMIVDEYRPQY